MRGLAILLMIQCHTFNSFARMDVREGGPYVLSQFVGGMAAAAPLVANLPWGDTPRIVLDYLAPGQGQGRGRFPLFPNAAYLAFGLAIGSIVKGTVQERFDRLMQWGVLIGFALVFTGQYLS